MEHAYNKLFLPEFQQNLGFAFDFAINVCGVESDTFFDYFISSKISKEIEMESPKFVCGCYGTELALFNFERVGFDFDENILNQDICRFDRTPEYWAGWILAYYQGQTGISFSTIREKINFRQIVQMYNPLHEASEEKFVEVMDGIFNKQN